MRPTSCRWAYTKSLKHRGRSCSAIAQWRVTWSGSETVYYVCQQHIAGAVRTAQTATVRFLSGNPSSAIPKILRRLGWPIIARRQA